MAELPPEGKDMLEQLWRIPAHLKQVLQSVAGVWVLAWLGRMLWHVGEVQRGRRRFWSLHLLWEVLTAIAIGFFAEGVAVYLGLVGKPAMAVIIAVAYLGPRGIEELFARFYGVWTGRKGGKGMTAHQIPTRRRTCTRPP